MAEKKYVYAFEEAYGLGKEFPLKLAHSTMKVAKKSQTSLEHKSSMQLKRSKRKPEKHSVATTIHF